MNESNHDDSTSGADNDEILRLDPAQRLKLRRLVAALVIALVLIGLLVKHWMNLDDRYLAMHRMIQMSYVLAFALLAIAGYLGWYARRIHVAAQYPPPGGWILGDTRVLRGDAARIHARWLIVCAAGFAAFAIYAGIVAHDIASMRVPPLELLVPQIVAPHG